jgi:uncharacterized lipoprotein YddW (UPF0748 family)
MKKTGTKSKVAARAGAKRRTTSRPLQRLFVGRHVRVRGLLHLPQQLLTFRVIFSEPSGMKQACIYLSLAMLVVLLLASCRKEVFTGKREARGVWMSRFEYTSSVLQNDPEAAKAYIRSVFEKARKAKFNMVFFQVRGNGTSFYHSSFEPWAAELTGLLGKDPGWDPLQFAIDEAHRLGLELHAWINTFPIWRGGIPPIETNPPQPLLAHPEWVVCDGGGKPMTVDAPKEGYIWASPGIPAVRRHVLGVVMDIVTKYDVDGIHFDYIRYPEESPSRGYSHDSISVARFNSVEGNPYKLAWDHWQREQVNEFVFKAYNALTAAKPWVKVSAAVIGKYMGAGWNSYSVVYQDPRAWMELGKIDFIVPMVYWERSHPTHPFDPLIAQWQDRVAYNRYILPGLSTDLIAKAGWKELSAEIQDIRQKGLPGVVFFSAGGLGQMWSTLGVDEFPYWSLVPSMAWKESIFPPAPAELAAEFSQGAVVLTWDAPAVSEPLSYVIYGSRRQQISVEDVSSIVSITGRGVTSFVDAKPRQGDWHYGVTAVDRLGNESPLSATVSIRVPAIAARAGTTSGENGQTLRLAGREHVWPH